MAKGWQRDKQGRVWFYYSQDGNQKKVPRSETKHLDTEPDHNVAAERTRWGLVNLGTKPQWDTLTHDDTLALVAAFCAYLETRKKSPKTVSQHRHNLNDYCLPFFVQKEGLTDPVLWPKKSVRLLEHLQGLEVGARTINTCNVSLRVFWDWLVEEGRATGALLLRNSVSGDDETPLNFTVTPKDILDQLYKTPELAILALVGYFFSLRPQELVALRPCDFRAGSAAIDLEACKVMAQHGLYSRLAVNVHRQRVGNSFKTPKANSKGWVACFHEGAAREIVAALKNEPPYELIFKHRLDWWFKLWAKKGHGYPGLTLKDLRRASLYWLGNHTQISFTALKNHARHADPSTTALYVRRPGEEASEFSPLDLDA